MLHLSQNWIMLRFKDFLENTFGAWKNPNGWTCFRWTSVFYNRYSSFLEWLQSLFFQKKSQLSNSYQSCQLKEKKKYFVHCCYYILAWDTQLRAKFQTARVSCSRFIWITNSSDHRRIWTANLLHTRELSNPLGHKQSSVLKSTSLGTKTLVGHCS